MKIFCFWYIYVYNCAISIAQHHPARGYLVSFNKKKKRKQLSNDDKEKINKLVER